MLIEPHPLSTGKDEGEKRVCMNEPERQALSGGRSAQSDRRRAARNGQIDTPRTTKSLRPLCSHVLCQVVGLLAKRSVSPTLSAHLGSPPTPRCSPPVSPCFFLVPCSFTAMLAAVVSRGGMEGGWVAGSLGKGGGVFLHRCTGGRRGNVFAIQTLVRTPVLRVLMPSLCSVVPVVLTTVQFVL